MKKAILFLYAASVCFFISSCENQQEDKSSATAQSEVQNREEMLAVMNAHLDAVTNKDLVALENTLSPNGNMQLILTGSEIIEKVSGFVDYHREWFKMGGWTMESKILNHEVGHEMGMVVVESLYKEKERNGVPYFNRLTVSYVLKKINGKWYIIKDHATSNEKSTDKK